MYAESLTEEVKSLDAAIVALGRERCRMLARVARLLHEMTRTKGYVALGFASIADYARARLDFSGWKTRDLVELTERASGLPVVREAFETGRVSWTKLRAVARIATPESEGEWIERAERLTCRQLEASVAEAQGTEPGRVRVVLDLSAEQYADLEDALVEVRKERGSSCSREQAVLELIGRGLRAGESNETRPPFQTVVYRCERCNAATRETREGPVPASAETAARAACDAEVVDARAPARVTKTIPPRLRRFVLRRDHGRCVVPGCANRHWCEVHHVVPRALGGTHDPEYLATLCGVHHGAVHAGLLLIGGSGARGFRFFRSDGSEIVGPATPPECSREHRISDAARTLLSAAYEDRIGVDEFVERYGTTASQAHCAVSELEMVGLVHRRGGLLVPGGG